MARLRIKRFQDIFSSLVTWITTDNPNLSDFNVGSALRTLSEAIALEMEELYFNMHQNIEYAISTAIYSAFGFERRLETYASTYVRFTLVEPAFNDFILPRGFTVSTSLAKSKIVYYRTTTDITVPKGSLEFVAPVLCTEAGEVGNVEPGEINTIVTLNGRLESVTNDLRVVSGVDRETTASLKSRFKEYLRSLGRATRDSVEYGIKSVPGVAGVKIDDQYIGFVNAYVHDKNGNLPKDLLDAITKELVNWRAAGIEVKVLPCVKVPVDVDTVTLITKDDVDVQAILPDINTLVKNFLNSYSVGKSFYVSDLITLITKNYGGIIATIDTCEVKNINVLENMVIVAGEVDLKSVPLGKWG